MQVSQKNHENLIIKSMEDIKHLFVISRYMYYLEEDDLIFVNEWNTALLNSGFPGLIGGWFAKRTYVVLNPNTSRLRRYQLSMMPLVLAGIGIGIMHFFWYRNSEKFQYLVQKYPPGTDFKARTRQNPFKVYKNQQDSRNK